MNLGEYCRNLKCIVVELWIYQLTNEAMPFVSCISQTIPEIINCLFENVDFNNYGSFDLDLGYIKGSLFKHSKFTNHCPKCALTRESNTLKPTLSGPTIQI